jgi:hypothetical protein
MSKKAKRKRIARLRELTAPAASPAPVSSDSKGNAGKKKRIARLRAADPDYPPKAAPVPPPVPVKESPLPKLVLENPS